MVCELRIVGVGFGDDHTIHECQNCKKNVQILCTYMDQPSVHQEPIQNLFERESVCYTKCSNSSWKEFCIFGLH